MGGIIIVAKPVGLIAGSTADRIVHRRLASSLHVRTLRQCARNPPIEGVPILGLVICDAKD